MIIPELLERIEFDSRPIDKKLSLLFQSKPWRQVFRAQLAATIASSNPAPTGIIKPDYLAKESVKVADAILAEVGLMERPKPAKPPVL